jgi:DNA-binding transcriptional ArsR family regulator
MPLTNPFGDVEISDPRAMRALAHPVRLAVLTHLQRHGPATATQLAPIVEASPSVTSWHLRHLASFGLVEDSDAGSDGRQRWWRAVARGFRFSLPPGDEGAAAYSLLSGQLFDAALDQAHKWRSDVEPRLTDEWRRLSGTANTRLVVTADELEHIEAEIEKLIAPYVTRDPADVPPGGRSTRLLRIHMPSADGDTDAGATDRESAP